VTARAGRRRVPAEWAGERVDRALASHLELPRSQVRKWILAGRVEIDGVALDKPGRLLRADEELIWSVPPPVDDRVVPETGELRVLYEDGDLIALDKPAGLVVHPGAGRRTGTLAHRLLARYPELAGVGGPGRPGIVHRLDQGTSGLLVVARNAETYHRLVRLFAQRRIDKRYLAIVWGAPATPAGEIEAPIGRHPHERKRMAVVTRGKPARTGWRRLAAGGAIALVELRLWTGRTHQIRVHLRHLGHPLVGDPVYGDARAKRLRSPAASALAAFPRPALHAWRLAFDHPGDGRPLRFEAPVPADFGELWRAATGVPLPPLERP
jgi:23S rRNA pseudouridine1911/1915/1917 synthase